jgi:hypothetical protein
MIQMAICMLWSNERVDQLFGAAAACALLQAS